MLVTILDGYIDEPSCLGIPPYISPYVRYAAGAIKDTGHDYQYITIDQWRKGQKIKGRVLLIITGAVVPGRYLRGMPISFNEFYKITSTFKGVKILGGAAASYGIGQGGGKEPKKSNNLVDYAAKKDADAFIFDFLNKEINDRKRTANEWKKWSVLGAEVVKYHPDFPNPLIAEVETYRGCTRYISGGCSFCMEPLFGKPIVRDAKDIVNEIKILYDIGVKNFRLGCQSCFYSYGAKGIGKSELPEPNVNAIKKLLEGIRKKAPMLNVLHIDNVNPSIIAEYPEKAIEITELIKQYCTPGNTAAFGMESADMEVIKKNNLNATPEEVMKAIEIINEIGRERGSNGMPYFLPGLNILYGLPGENANTYKKNYAFLKSVIDRGLLLRRVNIRQVVPIRIKKIKIDKKRFKEFKRVVDENINRPMLEKIVPYGTVLKNVFLEINKGNATFGRQVGSYPLLVCLPYKKNVGKFVDVKIKDYGYRSITGIEYPLNINHANMKAIESLPAIGKKRAVRIMANRPFKNFEELDKVMDSVFNKEEINNWISLK